VPHGEADLGRSNQAIALAVAVPSVFESFRRRIEGIIGCSQVTSRERMTAFPAKALRHFVPQ
jgi:hypothetical protein